ncbi:MULTISPECIES: deoxynucleoside kinase [Deinococcus]|uniref:Deoxynucleoside kinase n=1 Tax=Deinococcus geothermalis (strain DSM 11300 / CIP 105573 / AG-3a) TaxID=319795 RepID=Q1J280_DEIGD|nr:MULTISPECIES: deoxynucleoside kinase [Deinococcus]ABF44404.1 deoxynucleoside kinase [Deinococcus geothermalis DSM 11300]MBI0446135.1 deoxynucleoside kinase [Deinococcus sp. DB0503]TDE85183.1 deoxynucleoside kinase [Deinococcus sp. S9]
MYLALSGNIGSGKSTLTRMLAERYGLRPVYEPYAENPYLEDFYRDMRRYSFHSQVYFLSRRLEQHLNLVTGARYVIQDRTVFEDANIFARNLFESGQMEARDWATYLGLYQGILPALRVPDLLIHIDASVPTLKKRIAQRGRAYEKAIPDTYLAGLNRLYAQWIENFDACPVMRVPGDELDFVQDPAAFRWVCDRVQAYGFGLPLLR